MFEIEKYYDGFYAYLKSFDYEYIKEYACNIYNPFNDVKDLNKDILRSILKRIKQKEKNIDVLKDMVHIRDIAFDYNIKHVFVKGLMLANNIYDSPEDRFFNDIDIYIHEDDLHNFINIIGQLGYIDENYDTISGERFDEYYHPSHLVPFIKKSSNIVLEVHVIPFYINALYPSLVEFSYNTLLLSNIKEDLYGEEEFYVLDENVNLLFLIDHFIKHIISSTIGVFKNLNSSLEIELIKLFEIKLFYEKNKNKISHDYLLELIKSFGINNQLILGLKYLNEIFPDTIKLNINHITGKKANLYENILCQLYETYTLSEMIKSKCDMAWIKDNLRKMGYCPGLILNVPMKSPGVSGIKFSINENSVSNIWETHMRYGEKPLSVSDKSLSGTMQWDSIYLYFNFFILDCKCPETEGNLIILKFQTERDNFEDKNYTVFLRFLLSEKMDSYVYYDLVLDNGFNISEKCIFSSCYNINNGYSIFLAFPFELIKIIPEINMKIGFEIYFNRYDTNSKLVNSQALSCINDQFDSRTYAEINLSERITFKEE